MKKNGWILGGLLALTSGAAPAIDGVAVEGGRGDGADMGRLAIQWDWKSRWLEGQTWHAGGYWTLRPMPSRAGN